MKTCPTDAVLFNAGRRERLGCSPDDVRERVQVLNNRNSAFVETRQPFGFWWTPELDQANPRFRGVDRIEVRSRRLLRGVGRRNARQVKPVAILQNDGARNGVGAPSFDLDKGEVCMPVDEPHLLGQ
jgi:hypothetical protein